MALTPKQQRFVAEYLVDLNATRAYLRAGYKVKETSARVQSCRLLANPNIADAIEAAKKARSDRTEITQDRVLQELARIAFFDLRKLYRKDGSLKAMHELDDDAAAVLSGVDVVETMKTTFEDGEPKHQPEFTKKVKIPDKVGALGLAMRHLGMLKDKTEITGKDGQPLQSAGVLVVNPVMSPDEWARAAKAQQDALTSGDA